MYQQPGPTPNYRQHDFTFTPDQSQIYNGGDHKTQGVRFKPKNRLNDPVFLIFFVLQVRLLSFHLPYKATVFVVSRIHRFVWHSPDNMDITRRFGGRPWCGWRSNGQSSYIEQVLHFILTFLLLYFCQQEHRLSTSSDYCCSSLFFSRLSHLDSHIHQNHYAHHPGSYDFA